ncbi:MAG TPA: chromosomal replication initiator protein DnaA [Ktedonobacterales bacterium]|nr:chromosomal replication initiator protein DnaA [Ktedonobacterales bacterium]
MSNAHVWRAAQERLRRDMTRAQFDTWLRGTWLAASDDGATLLCVRTTFARELLEARFHDRIAAAIAEVNGQPCRLRIVVAAAGAAPTNGAATGLFESAGDNGNGGERGELASSPDANGHVTGDARDAHDARAEGMPPATQAPTPGPGLPGASGRRRVGGATGGPASVRNERVRAAVERARAAEQRTRRDGGEAAGRRLEGEAADGEGESEMPDGAALPARPGVGIPHGGPSSAGGESAGRGGAGGANGVVREERAMPDDDMPNPSGPPPAYTGPAIPPPRLNARYTFDTFIVGGGNRLAHAASAAVAEAPGLAYKTLFLYGGVGLGKTHLLHAIGHTAIERGLTVLYVSSETFTNEIINAILRRTTEEFRAKYRSVDLLLVDDIQFIAGKDSTEEEFFHTFNSLYEMNRQIVICSDRPPKAIVSLAERLRSRFEWGLIADIQPPDMETRIAILRAKSAAMGRNVPDEVTNWLANRVQSNIRELEGSFNRLFAFSQLQGLPLTIDTAKAALANLSNDARARRVSIPEILEAVCEYYRISADDLCGKQRDKHIVVPRQVAMYLMRQETEASLLEIGQALGGRDHSTVLHGCEKIEREMNDNTPLRKEIGAIRQQLHG